MPRIIKYIVFVFTLTGFLLFVTVTFAQWDVTDEGKGNIKDAFKGSKSGLKIQPGQSVEMQADQVQYSASSNIANAKGNVTVKSGPTTIYADQVQLDRGHQIAYMEGKVYIDSDQFQVDAESGQIQLTDKTGEFHNARIWNAPFMISGREVQKVSDTHMVMQDGYLTTCDLDEPHYRFQMKRMDYYQGDKAVAKGVKVYIGQVPVMYLPGFTQDLKNKPWFTFAPGHKKDLGYFLLTRSHIKINDYWDATLRLDAYEREGFAWGSENKYRIPGMGGGLLRTYFINEREIAARHPWIPKTGPTVENERYQLEWRHKWDIDPRTTAIWQYYRLSDDVILPKYFEREWRRDPDVSTYFLLTRAMPVGSLSFRVDHRVNRFVSAIDRTPEIEYTVAGYELGQSGVYLKSDNVFSDLVYRAASPTEDRRKTIRFDSNNEITYPTHIAFVQFTPMVGGDETYYSRTIDPDRPNNIVRSTFKTGADFTTRFMRVFTFPNGFMGTDITKLRHIISPEVNYLYQHTPTFAASRLNQFDTAIDSLTHEHVINFSVENKIQGKRGKNTVDLLRIITSTPYTIRQPDGVKGQLGLIENQVEITPNDWFRIVSDTYFNHRKGRLEQSNLDFYFQVNRKLGFDLGDSYAHGSDHQVITQLAYVINPLWKFKIYDRFDPKGLDVKEEQYELTRDLHEWEVNFLYGETRGQGSEFLITFRLKAFPGQLFDLLGTSFHERKAGSQSDVTQQ